MEINYKKKYILYKNKYLEIQKKYDGKNVMKGGKFTFNGKEFEATDPLSTYSTYEAALYNTLFKWNNKYSKGNVRYIEQLDEILTDSKNLPEDAKKWFNKDGKEGKLKSRFYTKFLRSGMSDVLSQIKKHNIYYPEYIEYIGKLLNIICEYRKDQDDKLQKNTMTQDNINHITITELWCDINNKWINLPLDLSGVILKFEELHYDKKKVTKFFGDWVKNNTQSRENLKYQEDILLIWAYLHLLSVSNIKKYHINDIQEAIIKKFWEGRPELVETESNRWKKWENSDPEKTKKWYNSNKIKNDRKTLEYEEQKQEDDQGIKESEFNDETREKIIDYWMRFINLENRMEFAIHIVRSMYEEWKEKDKERGDLRQRKVTNELGKLEEEHKKREVLFNKSFEKLKEAKILEETREEEIIDVVNKLDELEKKFNENLNLSEGEEITKFKEDWVVSEQQRLRELGDMRLPNENYDTDEIDADEIDANEITHEEWSAISADINAEWSQISAIVREVQEEDEDKIKKINTKKINTWEFDKFENQVMYNIFLEEVGEEKLKTLLEEKINTDWEEVREEVGDLYDEITDESFEKYSNLRDMYLEEAEKWYLFLKSIGPEIWKHYVEMHWRGTIEELEMETANMEDFFKKNLKKYNFYYGTDYKYIFSNKVYIFKDIITSWIDRLRELKKQFSDITLDSEHLLGSPMKNNKIPNMKLPLEKFVSYLKSKHVPEEYIQSDTEKKMKALGYDPDDEDDIKIISKEPKQSIPKQLRQLRPLSMPQSEEQIGKRRRLKAVRGARRRGNLTGVL